MQEMASLNLPFLDSQSTMMSPHIEYYEVQCEGGKERQSKGNREGSPTRLPRGTCTGRVTLQKRLDL